MKIFNLQLFVVLTILFLAAACNDDDGNPTDNCYRSVNTGFDSVAGPETGTVNEPILFDATFGVSNGCGNFVNFVESNSLPKEIYARVDYTGCVCTDVYQVLTQPYTFTAATAGVYELRFMKPDGTYISKTVVVTE